MKQPRDAARRPGPRPIGVLPVSEKKMPARGDPAKKLACDSIPKAIASGVLVGPLAFIASDCHVLEGEVRVLGARGAMRAITGGGAKDGTFGRLLERISGGSNVLEVEPRIRFVANGQVHVGIRAEDLGRLCTAITDMALAGTLHHKRKHLLVNARRIEKALVNVAIVALVDESCGYQKDRKPDALAELFAQYLLAEPSARGAVRTIPEDLYVGLARLYRHGYTRGQLRRPMFFRGWTWKFVYSFLPQSVRDEIQRRNPNPHKHSTRHYQHLSPASRKILNAHLLRLTTVVNQSSGVADFVARFDHEFRGTGLQLSF